MREICLDTETTGLDPRDGHRIVEIGCVEIINKVKTDKSYHQYINPERDMPDGAFRIHGLSTEFLKDKPKFSEVASEFIKFIGDDKLIIHNASFDMKFINSELRSCDLEIIERRNVIDSLELARNKFPGAGNSLDALCKRFNIDSSRRVKHGALLDAELLCDVYIELMGGNQISMFGGGKSSNVESLKEDHIQQKTKRSSIPARSFPLSEDELSAHKKFILDNFKDNFWGY
jgi:DNA polymerase-3 subunit epsilon